MNQPKGLVYKEEYEPDMDRMVQALRVLLNYQGESFSEGRGGTGGTPVCCHDRDTDAIPREG